MTKGYRVARVGVDDADACWGRFATNATCVATYGTRFLARGGPRRIRNSHALTRTAAPEFVSHEQVIAYRESAACEKAEKVPDPAFTCDPATIQSYDG